MADESKKKENAFETTAKEATDLPDGAGWFNRKGVLATVCISLGAVAVAGMLLANNARPSGAAARNEAQNPATASAGFLDSLRNQAAARTAADGGTLDALPPEEAPPEEPEPFPIVAFARDEPPPPPERPAPPPRRDPQPAQPAPDPTLEARRSRMAPDKIDGSLFGNAAAFPQNGEAEGGPYRTPAATGVPPSAPPQSGADVGFELFGPSAGGAVSGGFIEGDAVWIGTIIPGVLITAINTDLPGGVLARVSRNVYDSRTGRTLLIPQGTIMAAKYNSSVSYAQRRVQIVWDTLIRPDGFLVDLEGMDGADAEGMSGQGARYRENWFEYAKAAAVVTVFSLAGSAMAETAAHYSDAAAASAAASGSEMVNRTGQNMIDRAMDIQPTLTVASGAHVNIMVNKTIRLPPAPQIPVTERFTLE